MKNRRTSHPPRETVRGETCWNCRAHAGRQRTVPAKWISGLVEGLGGRTFAQARTCANCGSPMELTGRAHSVVIFHAGKGASQVVSIERATQALGKQVVAMLVDRVPAEELRSLVVVVFEDRMTARLRPLSIRMIREIKKRRRRNSPGTHPTQSEEETRS